MIQSAQTAPRKKGRPLAFDREVALHQAMLLFWRHGYESTSLNDLAAALDVPPSSIYSAFGDKKGFFLAVVDYYLARPATFEAIIEHATTAFDAIGELLQAAAIKFTGIDTPPGGLLASAAISCSPAAADVKEALADRRRAAEALLKRRIERAIGAGELPSTLDADALAGHAMAIIQGMSTLARDGASREKLWRVAKTAMGSWSALATPNTEPVEAFAATGHAAKITPL